MKTYPLLVLALTACGQIPENKEDASVDLQKITAKVTTQSDPEPELNNSVSLTLSSSLALPECTQDRSGQLVWLLQEKEFRSCVPEKNQWVIVSIVGERGERGESGAAGTSCSVKSSENGANVACGQDEVFIANGSPGVSLPGISGRDGASCAAERGQGGVSITCGNQEPVFVADGESIQGPAGNDGSSGASCSAARAIGGINITCGVQEPVFIADGQSIQGASGRDGTSCSAARAIGGVNITCGVQEPVFIADGQSIQGIAGNDGSDGRSARQVMVRTFPSPSAGTCPGNADFMWISFYFDDNNNGVFDEATDEEFKSEPICQGSTGPAGIQGVAGQDGSDANIGTQPYLYRGGVRIGRILGPNPQRYGTTQLVFLLAVDGTSEIIDFNFSNNRIAQTVMLYANSCDDTVAYTDLSKIDLRTTLHLESNVITQRAWRQDNTPVPSVTSRAESYGSIDTLTCQGNAPVTRYSNWQMRKEVSIPAPIMSLLTLNPAQNPAEIRYE